MKKIIKACLLGAVFLSLNMSVHADDDDKPPGWVKNPSRTVDNGYIVYVASGEDPMPERARLKAEGTAIQDLANECSFAPKGSRVEDSYQEVKKDINKVYVKLAVEFTDCDEAKKTNDPQEIKKMASLPMTEELKRFQDLVDTEVASTGPAIAPPPNESSSPGSSQTVAQQTVIINNQPGFFYWRQQMVYEKEVVIVSPPTAYAPGSPESTAFVHRVGPMSQQIGTYERNNPQIMKSNQTWSSMPDRPSAPRPQTLAGQNRPGNAPKRTEIGNHGGEQHQQQRSQQPFHRGGRHRRW